ncbi:MAG: thioesterase family protein [Alphaproteobacteria bacterium]
MPELFETHRGSVKAWECDSFGHFTVAYYFDRFSDASAAALAALREGKLLPAGQHWQAVAYTARFQQELRSGDGLHIESGVIAADPQHLSLGHKVMNSTSGEVAATVEETLVPAPGSASLAPAFLAGLEAGRLSWPAAKRQESAVPDGGKGFMTSARDVVRAWEVDEGGGLALPFYIHRTSAGSGQLLASVGLSADYLRSAGRGFATFEIRLSLHEPRPRAGERLRLESALQRLGTSSLEMLHRLYEASSGCLVASASQSGAHFDLATRRSTPIPQALREKAAGFLVGQRN